MKMQVRKQQPPSTITSSSAATTMNQTRATLEPPDTIKDSHAPTTRTSRFLPKSRSKQHLKDSGGDDAIHEEGLPPRSSSSSSYRGSETGAPTTTSGIDSSHSDVFTQAETPFVSPLTRTRSPLHTSPPRRNGGNIFAFSSPPRQTSQDSSRSAVGVWFSNILSSSQNQGSQSSSSSKIPDETASVRSYASGATSPSRFLSRKSVRDSPGRRSTFANVQYGGGTSASLQSQRQAPDQANQLSQQAKPPQGRLGGFDRIFDRALQFFTDADSNVDRSPEDIWLMGVRHDGWRPERSLSPTRSHAERPSIDTISSENYPHVIDSGSGSPRQQTTRQTMLSGARRLSKSSNRTQSSKETSVSPPQKESPAAAKRNRPGDYFKAKARKNVSRDSVPSGHLMDRSHSGSSTSSGPHGSVPVGHTQGDVHNGSASQSHDGNEFPYVNGRKEDDAVSILTFSTETQSTHRGPSIVPAPTSTAQTMGWPPGFYHDFYSRIQLTYRSGFSPLPSDPLPPAAGSSVASAITNMMNNLNVSIGRANTSPTAGDVQLPTGLTSDSGWGCMLRTGQSLLANALLDVHLGRDFRRPLPVTASELSHPTFFSSHPLYSRYVRLVSWFFDHDSPTSPFSVHKFAVEGKKLGKQIGEWFGPSTAAGAIKVLANDFSPANLGVAMAIDTSVYGSEVFGVARGNHAHGWHRPVLILVPLRLGLNGVNPIYYNSIQHYFTLPQCVGIAGGRPSSSYYFVGAQGTQLFYMDPHHTKPAVKVVPIPEQLRALGQEAPLSPSRPSSPKDQPVYDDLSLFFANAYRPEALESFHCDKVRKMAFGALDPSMLVGLLCQTKEDWDDLCTRMKAFPSSKDNHPLLHIAQEMPAWMRNPSRTMSGTGIHQKTRNTASKGMSNGAPSSDSAFLPANRTAKEATLSGSPEDAAGTSFDYADSDDWDIDESDGEACESVSSDQASIVVKPPRAAGALSSPSFADTGLPSRTDFNTGDASEPHHIAGASDDFEQIETARDENGIPASPVAQIDLQEADTVFIASNTRETPHRVVADVSERLSLEAEDKDAGWEAYPSHQTR